MAATLTVPEEMKETLQEFCGSENIDVTLSTADGGAVTIVPGQLRQESTPSELYPGGWIPCATALGMAETLAIPSDALGKLLNKIDVKVRNCELGCF